MKRIIFLLLVLPLTAFTQNDTTIGDKAFKLSIDNCRDSAFKCWIERLDPMDGKYFAIYPDGKLKESGYYNKGKKTRQWVGYYKNGVISYNGYYKHGLEDSEWITYYPDGAFCSQGQYKNGLKEFMWKGYYQNGKLIYRGMYFHGMNSGTWRHWYEDGKLKSQVHYIIRTEVSKERVKQLPETQGKKGKLRVKRQYTIMPIDSMMEYYPDGKLKCKIFYTKQGNPKGKVEFFYPDGKVNRVELWNDDHPLGCWIYYCPDGKLSKVQQQDIDANCEAPEFTIEDCNYPGDVVPDIQWMIMMNPPVFAKF